MFKLIAGLLLAGFAAPAAAESWYAIDPSPEMAYYLDGDGLQRDGDTVRLTIVVAWQQPVDGTAVFARIGERYDCQNFRRRMEEVTVYDADRRVLDSQAETAEWSEIPEGSAAHDMWRFGCEGPFGTAVDDPFAAGARFREGKDGG